MDALDDRSRIGTMVFGAMAAQVLHTAAQLQIADHLGDEEWSAADLAARTDTDPPSMNRLLRALAAVEVLTEVSAGTFRLTSMGALLRTDRPDSLEAFVVMFGDPAMLAAWRELPAAIRTGNQTFGQLFGKSFFEYLAERPDLSKRFNASMRQATALTAQQLPTSYDFSRFGTVADIGGGDGTLLAAVLAVHDHLRGILYDTAEGLAQATETLSAMGVAERCTVVPGDFFTGAPEGADLYLIKSVLHDWDDARSRAILGHVRNVIGHRGRLLIIEPVLPPMVDRSLSPITYLSDLNMLVNLGGRERTRQDFESICAASRFELKSVTSLAPPSGYCLIEAQPVV